MKTNFHTHTTHCDGRYTVTQMVEEAIARGFDILGFSGHSMYPFSSGWHIAVRDFPDYINDVRSAAQKYHDKIQILCGVEADYIANKNYCLTTPDKQNYAPLNLDYIIGSVHYVTNGRGIFAIDGKAEEVRHGIDTFWQGDAKAAICAYFKSQRNMLWRSKFDIWAHPDVCRRRNDELHLFCEDEGWYQDELQKTADVAKRSGVIAEVNTGGWARGNVSTPYPSLAFLKMLHERGVPIIINSDAHDAPKLDFGFENSDSSAIKYVKEAGYTSVAVLLPKDDGSPGCTVSFQSI